ncbi:MAG: Asp-tRNA(Asn)/Glu-tRNA(Gln) amidotransferase subunit GatB [Cyclobacteriaceae bacterium]
MSSEEIYEPVIGLEVHVQLATKSKIFSSDQNSFGQEPNTNIGAVTMAHPGTLPLVSKEVVELAMKMGLALDCDITRYLIFDRKNYFYPDLPKGYQITQDATPICQNGGLEILVDQKSYFIELTKIHLEEDAGKSIHVDGSNYTHVDLNRAGVPLIEIVTEPCVENAEQAAAFLTEIRKIIRYLRVSDGNMEEGSMRCDANISIRRKGEELGSKVEVKNMNSIRNVKRAINVEIARQRKLKSVGEEIISETRTYDPNSNTTSGMRTKEELNDYRYFPEPDISPIVISDEWLQEVKQRMHALPSVVKAQLIDEYKLSEYNAGLISEEREFADYYFELVKTTSAYKSAANWVLGAVKSFINKEGISIEQFRLNPAQLGELINLVEEGKVSHTAANQQLFKYLLDNDVEPLAAAERLNLIQSGDQNEIQTLVDEVLNAHPEKVKAYHNGKKGLAGMFMGELMKKAKGLDPKVANQLIRETLEKLK